jgi:hypothetical protein
MDPYITDESAWKTFADHARASRAVLRSGQHEHE